MEQNLESKLEPIEVTLARRWAEFRMRRLAWMGCVFTWMKGNRPAGHSLLFLLCLGIVLNLVSIVAPGYWAWDEHAVNAYVKSGDGFIGDMVGFVPWGEFSRIRYSPLLWEIRLIMSDKLYDTPAFFILSSVLLSVVNGVLLYYLVLRFSGQRQAALWAFFAFNLFPSVAFVAGWVATTDKLYLICVLGAIHFLLWDREEALKNPSHIWPQASPLFLKSWKLSRPEAWRQAGIAMLFVLGFLSKESALMLPAAIGGFCLLVKPWRGWWWSLALTSLILGIYLSLRLPAIFIGNPYVNPESAKSLHLILAHWLYPFVLSAIDAWEVLHSPNGYRWLAGLLASLPILFLLRRSWRFALSYIFYYYVFIAPTLFFTVAASNYSYGAALPVATLFAWVFRYAGAPETKRYAERGSVRVFALVLFAVLALHSAKLQCHFYESGVWQQRAYASLSAIVRSHDRRAGNSETKFAIRADSGPAWRRLYRNFWPTDRGSIAAGNVGGLNLINRVAVHHSWPGGHHEIPTDFVDSVRLLVTPEGYVVQE